MNESGLRLLCSLKGNSLRGKVIGIGAKGYFVLSCGEKSMQSYCACEDSDGRRGGASLFHRVSLAD